MDFAKSLPGFVETLKQKQMEIAFLQLTGKLEGYLVNQYLYYLFQASNQSLFGLTNLGCKKENKVDIAIMRRPDPRQYQEIVAMFEAKYLRNRHRNWADSPAFDEARSALVDLARQVMFQPGPDHGFYSVNPDGRVSPYGLVFASFVKRECDTKRSMKNETLAAFLAKITGHAEGLGFHDVGATTVSFHIAYQNQLLAFHEQVYHVSLAVGLWVRGETLGLSQ